MLQAPGCLLYRQLCLHRVIVLVVTFMTILMEIMYNVILTPLLWGDVNSIVDLGKRLEISGREMKLKI